MYSLSETDYPLTYYINDVLVSAEAVSPRVYLSRCAASGLACSSNFNDPEDPYVVGPVKVQYS